MKGNKRTIIAGLIATAFIGLTGMSQQAYAQDGAFAFNDVNSSDWFYEPVMTLAGEGIINGYDDGSYKPQNSVTNAEALKMIFVAADIQIELPQIGENWAANIIEEAENRGIIDGGSFDADSYATREEIAEYTVKAMNWQNASYENDIFQDANQKAVNILYAKDIVIGSEGIYGYYYYPSEKITRAEISTIIVRLDQAQKERIGEIPFQIKPTIKAPAVFTKAEPTTEGDFINLFIKMASENSYSTTLSYSPSSRLAASEVQRDALVEVIEKAYNSAHAQYPEYVCYTNTLKVTQQARGNRYSLTLQLSNEEFRQTELTEMKTDFLESCEEIMNTLIEQGQIDGAMTEKEIARALYHYVVTNLSYDTSLQPESYLGYGATANGMAVCQGYTSLYNTLCKMSGIIVEGITGTATNSGETENHIWSLVTLDGQRSHVDTTYGDPIPDVEGRCDYSYFDVSTSFIKKNHTWREAEFDI